MCCRASRVRFTIRSPIVGHLMARHPRRRYRDEGWVAILMDVPYWLVLVVLVVVSLITVVGLAAVGLFVPAVRTTQSSIAGLLIVAFVVAAFWIALGERSVRRHHLRIASDLHRLGALSPIEFEHAASELLRLEGYLVTENRNPADEDGGVDFEAAKSGETLLVQCKHKWVDVNVREVRELWGLVASEGVTGGIFVTSARFTERAREFARGKRLRLVDGEEFLRLRATLLPGAGDHIEERDPMVSEGYARHLSTLLRPACPKCGKKMEVVTLLAGPVVTRQFWGCPDYPACQNSRRFSTPYVGPPGLSGSGPSTTWRERLVIARSNHVFLFGSRAKSAPTDGESQVGPL